MSGDVVDRAAAGAGEPGEPAAAPQAVVVAAEPAAEAEVPPWLGKAIWRGIWQLIAAALITAAALWLASRASALLRYLVLSQLLAFGLEPAVTWLHVRHGWRRSRATGVLLAGLLLLFTAIAVGIGSVLVAQVGQAAAQVPAWIDGLNDFAVRTFGTPLVSASSSARSGEATQQVVRYLQDHASDLLGAVGSLVGGIFTLFTIGLFTYYLTAYGPQVRRALLVRMPPERQRRVLWAWNTAIEKTGGYLYSRGLLALINGTLMFITLKILGVPYALPLAIFVGVVAEFIPIIGTYVAGVVPVVVALASVGPLAAVVVVAEMLVYQQVENYVLSPRISQKTMELNAGIAFGAALAGGAVGGFIGAFFALPIAAIAQAFLSTYSRRYEIVESDLTRLDAPAPDGPPA
jgi:predicted PurR-regulated permease PerM